jgi:hypothetical protein
MINCRVGLLDATRPKPVNQHPLAVVGSRAVIGSFQSHIFVGDFVTHRFAPVWDA